MYFLRTCFKQEIISEFLVPARTLTRPKVMILCGGMPSYPAGMRELALYFHKKGWWVFIPRYRGTWESGGQFLAQPPEKDVLDILDELPKGFTSIWDSKKLKVNAVKTVVLGNSFGGPAAILSTLDQRVAKAVAISSVTDWQAPSKLEPMDFLEKFVRGAFNHGYRFTPKDWRRLSQGKIYNPVNHIESINGKKLLLIHAKDDDNVLYKPAQKFANAVHASLISLARGGHGLNIMKRPALLTKIEAFIKN